MKKRLIFYGSIILRTINLDSLDDKYLLVEPICVEVATTEDDSGLLYWATVKCLQNELVFGVGRTVNDAISMLKQLIIEYYKNLLLSDFDRYHFEIYEIDKQYLQRKIHEASI
jgi:hypothetical protein